MKIKMSLLNLWKEINNMQSRTDAELLDVLTSDERKNFDLNVTIKWINKAMENVT